MLRIVSGPDPRDDYAREMRPRRPGRVRPRRPRRADRRGDLDTCPSRASCARRREQRRRGALESAGARPSRVPIRSMRRAYALYVTALNDGESSIAKMLADEGCEPLTMRRIFSAPAARTRRRSRCSPRSSGSPKLEPDGAHPPRPRRRPRLRPRGGRHRRRRRPPAPAPPARRAPPHGILLRPFSITPVVRLQPRRDCR